MRLRGTLGFVSLTLLTTLVRATISASDVPTPDFYGIYIVNEGKAVQLLDAQEGRSKIVGSVLSSWDGVVKPSGINAGSSSYVLIYQKESAYIERASLFRFRYCRTVTIGNGLAFNAKQEIPANMWVAAEEVKIQKGPVQGRQDLYRVMPMKPLSDGFYAVMFGTERGPSEHLSMFDFQVGGLQVEPATPPQQESTHTAGETSGGTAPTHLTRNGNCGNFESCSSSGWEAARSGNWAGAVVAFQGATAVDPARREGWLNLGRALLMAGRDESEVAKPWDTLLESGREVTLAACRKKLFSCEIGDLALSKSRVAFLSKGKEVFSAQAGQVSPGEVRTRSVLGTAFTSFQLKVAGKDEWFEYVPWNGRKCVHGANYFCEGDAARQQEVVGQYVQAAVKSLGNGTWK